MKVKAWFSQLNGAAWVKNFAYFSIIFIVGILLLYSNHKQYARDIPQAKINQYVDAFFQQPKVDIDTAGRPFWGNPDAKISIVEFSDFECPYCQKAAFTLKPLLANYRDKVKLVFINYPLDRSCNTAMERDLHEYACQAAYANHCAAEQGKFWEYHDESFKKQPRFKPEDLKKVAQKTKLDMDKFNSCMTAESTAEYIQKDLEQGKLAGIHGTPAIFVNGRPFQPWFFKNAWDSLITRLESNSQ